MSLSGPQRIEHSALMTYLALTLGSQRGTATWAEACAQNDILVADSYTREQVSLVLDTLSGSPGEVGAAARLTRLRLEPARKRAVTRPPVDVAPDVVDLAPYFMPAFAEVEIKGLLEMYATALKVDANSLTRADAVRLLDSMAPAEGLLGVVASFAKVKFFLKYPQ